MTDIRRFVDYLFEETRTPSIATSATAALVDGISQHLSPHITDPAVTRSAVIFYVNVLNDRNIRGLALAHDSILTLAQSVAIKISADDLGLEGIFGMIYDALKEVGPKDKINSGIYKSENTLLYFHLSSKKHPAYRPLALRLQRALRYLENEIYEVVTEEGLPRYKASARFGSAVIPFIHLVRFYDIQAGDPEIINDIPEEKIREAIRKGQDAKVVKYHEDKVAESYENVVISAINENYIPHFRKVITNWGIQVFYGRHLIDETVVDDIENETPLMSFSVRLALDSQAQREAEEAVYALEEAHVDSGGDVARRMLASQVRPSRFPRWWSRESVPLHNYSLVFAEVVAGISLSEVGSRRLSEAAFLLALMLYGFNPKSLRKMRVREIPPQCEDIVQGDMFCDPTGEFFYYRIEEDRVATLFSRTKELASDSYRKTTPIIVLPTGIMAPAVKALVRFVSESGREQKYLFSYGNGSNGLHTLTVQDFTKKIKAVRKTFGVNVSPFSFYRSFLNYVTGKYCVDPIVAAYVANRIPREIRAPVFYTNLTFKRLCSDVFSLQLNFVQDIFKNCKALGLNTETDLLDLEAQTDMPECPLTSFGSPFVPHEQKLKEALSQIDDTRMKAKQRDRALYFNLSTILIAFLWMLTCGLRRLEVEAMLAGDFSRGKMVLSVRGKSNRLYAVESRMIPVPSVVSEIHEGRERLQRRYRDDLIASGKYSLEVIGSREAASALFLVGHDGLPRPMSADGMVRVLRDNDLFPFRLGSLRHFVRTYLFEHGVSHEITNAFLGHQTKGKEYAGFYSFGMLEDMRQVISPLIDDLIGRLRLNDLLQDLK